MKRILLLALTLCLLLPAASAFADDGGWIIGLKAGYGWNNVSGGLTDSAPQVNATTADSFSNEDGWLGAVAIGYDWSGQGVNLRTELEYSFYDGIDYKHEAWNSTALTTKLNAKIDVQTLMLNFYYDFENSTSFTPYVGVGAGFAFIDADLDFDNPLVAGTDGNADTTNFAWNVGAGCAYELTEVISLDLQYKYVYFGDTDTYETGTLKFKADDLSSSDLTLGLRFTF